MNQTVDVGEEGRWTSRDFILTPWIFSGRDIGKLFISPWFVWIRIWRRRRQYQQPVPIEAGVLGIFALENLLEELIQQPIHDEQDKGYSESARWSRTTLQSGHGEMKSLVQRRRAENRKSHLVRMIPPPSNHHPLDFI
jgi:hypothetical protein